MEFHTAGLTAYSPKPGWKIRNAHKPANTPPVSREARSLKNNVRFGNTTEKAYPLHEMLRRERPPYTGWLGYAASFLDSDAWFKSYRPDVKSLERMLDRGNINLQDERKKTPLHVLMERRDATPDEIRLLLSRGANVNLQDQHGQTPLHVLMNRGDASPDEIGLLLSHENVNLPDHNGETPLRALIKRKDRPINPDEIRLLISHGANINLPDEQGKTPLHILTEKGGVSPDEIRLLLANGVNVHLKNNAGQTPIFALLDQEKPNLENIKALVEAGARLDEKSKVSKPPILGFLTRHANPDPEILKYLLANGVKLNEHYGFFKRTPLHWLMEHREPSVEALNLLLAHGANPHLKASGDTPLQHYQKQFPDHQLPEALQVLEHHMEKIRQHTPTLRIEELEETEKVPDRIQFVRAPEPSVASEIAPVSVKTATSPALPPHIAENIGPLANRLAKTAEESEKLCGYPDALPGARIIPTREVNRKARPFKFFPLFPMIL